MEHRWGERIGVDIPVRIAGSPFAVRNGRLLNLSVSGAAIDTTFELRPLSRIQIFLDTPSQVRSDAPSLDAYVTRVAKESIGIEWCEYGPEIVCELLQLLTFRRFSPMRVPTPPSIVGTIGSPPLLKRGNKTL
jgi:PilZ domain